MPKLLQFACLLAASTACSTGTASSGIAPATALIDLGDEEAKRLCAFQERTYKDGLLSTSQVCALEAALDSKNTEECDEQRNECVASGKVDQERSEDWRCERETARRLLEDVNRARCDVSVGQVEDCIVARMSAYRDAAAGATCAAPESSSNEELQTEECRTMQRLCPGLDADLFG